MRSLIIIVFTSMAAQFVHFAVTTGRVSALTPSTDTSVLFCSQCYSCSADGAPDPRLPACRARTRARRGVSTQRPRVPGQRRVRLGRHGPQTHPHQPVRAVCVRRKSTINTSYDVRRTVHDVQRTTYDVRRTTYDVRRTTYTPSHTCQPQVCRCFVA